MVFWGLESRKYFKHCLMGHTRGCMEDSGAKYNLMNFEGLTQAFSENFRIFFRKIILVTVLLKKMLPFSLISRVSLSLK